MKKIALLFTLAFVAVSVNAQNLKFGHINTTELVSLMSDTDSAMVKLKAYQTELEEEMDAMKVEYNNKLNTYQQKAATWTAAIKEAKEAELSEMVGRLEQFQVTAQQDLGQMNQTLMVPIYDKAKAAIDKIAKEKGLAFVFEMSTNPVIYYDEKISTDLLPLAKAALGIPAEKVAPSQIQ
ncbi:MAG: OmpH family outer membrane protein [Bacteroidales bacterium]|nr:OmpH family outer membrane protein [Candidatus Equibacterium intestinale]